MPTFRRAGLLGDAVASVLAQTVSDLECVVVDDAGGGVVGLPDDPRVRVIVRTHNGGTAASRNTGVDAARGRYVTFLDDDDLLTPDRLEIASEGLQRAPVAICWTRFLDGPLRPGRVLEGDVRDTILDSFVPHTAAVVVDRTRFVPFLEDLRSAEDVEWWLRLAHVAEVSTVRRCGHLYRRHDGPRYLKEADERVRGHVAMIELHAAYFAAHPSAAAFRWKRVGLLALQAGDGATARMAFRRSIRAQPSVRTARHLLRAM